MSRTKVSKRLKIDNLTNIVGESVLGFKVERSEGGLGFYKFFLREEECDKLHAIRLDRDAYFSANWHEDEYMIETINGNPKTKPLLISQLRDKKEFIINMIDLIRLSKI